MVAGYAGGVAVKTERRAKEKPQQIVPVTVSAAMEVDSSRFGPYYVTLTNKSLRLPRRLQETKDSPEHPVPYRHYHHYRHQTLFRYLTTSIPFLHFQLLRRIANKISLTLSPLQSLSSRLTLLLPRLLSPMLLQKGKKARQSQQSARSSYL